MQKENDVIILCNYNQEKRQRNYELGKEWSGIVYCLEGDYCNSKCCIFKKVVEAFDYGRRKKISSNL